MTMGVYHGTPPFSEPAVMESPIKHTDDTCPEIDSKGFCAAVFASSAQLCGRFARFFSEKRTKDAHVFFPFLSERSFRLSVLRCL